MTYNYVFFLSSSFTSGLQRHMVRHLYNEAITDSAQFLEQFLVKLNAPDNLLSK